MIAVSFDRAREIDDAAVLRFGSTETALVEKAGSSCAESLEAFLANRRASPGPATVVVAGNGNNAADAFVLARRLIESGRLHADRTLVVTKNPSPRANGTENRSDAPRALQSLRRPGVTVLPWSADAARACEEADLVIDGLTGTGLRGPAEGETAEIIRSINAGRPKNARLVASVDIPSGLRDAPRRDDPIIRADVTLAIEPIKKALYDPFARSYAGVIIPVAGIFPPDALRPGTSDAVLFDFREWAEQVPPVPADAYKHRRGVVELRAGAIGTTGAAKLALRGASAAGAGLIRLVVDRAIWPIVAAGEYGPVVRFEGGGRSVGGAPDAVLLGPGWGMARSRGRMLMNALDMERNGAALVLDADALRIYAENPKRFGTFSGRTIMTPHPLEFAHVAGVSNEDLAQDPDAAARELSARLNAIILLKGHVLRVAASDGRLAYIDGMEAVLGTGGSGDVLAGIAAGLAARAVRLARERNTEPDLFAVATASASLLIEAGKRARKEIGFCDPVEIARFAAKLGGDAWLQGD